MRALDLFCGAGGASKGISDAGFSVTGIDIEKQPKYPFKFIQKNVFDLEVDFLGEFDFIWASPPCQCYTPSTGQWKNKGYEYPDLVESTRELLLKTGIPFVIENVIQAPIRKDLILCGLNFGLPLYRHRAFEIHGFTVQQPNHKRHHGQQICDSIYGKARRAGQLKLWREALQTPWMNEAGLGEAIPPAYSNFIAKSIKKVIGDLRN